MFNGIWNMHMAYDYLVHIKQELTELMRYSIFRPQIKQGVGPPTEQRSGGSAKWCYALCLGSNISDLSQ